MRCRDRTMLIVLTPSVVERVQVALREGWLDQGVGAIDAGIEDADRWSVGARPNTRRPVHRPSIVLIAPDPIPRTPGLSVARRSSAIAPVTNSISSTAARVA